MAGVRRTRLVGRRSGYAHFLTLRSTGGWSLLRAEPSRGGQELFYKSQGNFMVVSVRTAPTFATGEARQLFSTQDYVARGNHRAYDVTENGQRFVMMRLPEAVGAPELIMVENFFEELKRLVPNR